MIVCLLCVKFSSQHPELDETPTPFTPLGTITLSPSLSSKVTAQRCWKLWVLLLLRCSYGVLDEYCSVSLLDCAGYKAKREAPFELQLIGQKGYPCRLLQGKRIS